MQPPTEYKKAGSEPKKLLVKPELKSLNVKWGYAREQNGVRALRSGSQYTRGKDGSLRKIKPERIV